MTKELKTIEICEVKIPLFKGSDTLKKLLINEVERDKGNKSWSEYPMDTLKEIELADDLELKTELDLVIKDLEDNGFDYLRIEIA